MNKAEREALLREKLAAMQEYENRLRAEGAVYIGGVDEVGRGPLAGPVVTACVVLPADFDVLGVDDSKKVSEKKRELLYDEITGRAQAYGIGMRDSRVIDEINILEATKEAMAEAVENAGAMLAERAAKEACGRASGGEGSGKGIGEGSDEGTAKAAVIEHLLIDALRLPDVDIPQTAIIKGDSKSLSIAAASIVAKVTRDRLMVEYHGEYPGYGFDRNKGYGTAAHIEGLRERGATPIHRKSFLKNMGL